MSEVGIAYQLIGPDGTRAVVGNCDAAKLDPDFIGYLDPENGITGLLDGADIRETAGDLVNGDGGWHGPFYEGRRAGTVNGLLLPNSDMPQVNAAERRLRRATRALRADGRLLWTPSGESIEREIRFRRQTKVAVTGRRPKAFQVGLVAEKSEVLSSLEAQLTITPDQAVGVVGFTSPITSPLATTASTTGQTIVTNVGDLPTWPRFRINGPITRPTILNNTTGESITLGGALLAGEFLLVDARRASVVFNGQADRYGLYDFSVSAWWQIQAGANDIRLGAVAYGAGAQLTIYWRHAWE